MPNDRRLLALTLLPLAYVAMGCSATPPPVSVEGLPLKRVVIYRNGVGYFERAGHVEAPQVRFRVRQNEVGDFLATMAVLEAGGSSVKSASFPLKIEEPDDDEDDDDRPRRKKKDPNGLVNVRLDLDGKKHDLQVGYIAEMPVWRPSYRLVVGSGGTADLQAWGIVQNLTGEDWTNVSLSLVAGAPLAFQATLGEPIVPQRPTVTDAGEVISAVPQSETTLAKTPPPPPPPPPMSQPAPAAAEPMPREERAFEKADKKEAKKGKSKSPSRSTASKDQPAAPRPGGPMGGAARGYAEAGDMDGAPMPKQEQMHQALSGPRNLASLAAVAMEGSSTRYDIPSLVTVPDKSATMVMLVSSRVSGESVFLFAPAPGVPDSNSHPFRVARFTNQTSGLLERGPIAVFEGGAFLGEGMVDPLPPGATTTVPFALERAIAVDHEMKMGEEGARIARIEAGSLVIERDLQMKTIYRLKNGSDRPAKMLVKHPRHNGTRLFQPPTGTEDNVGTGSALVPSDLAAHGQGELVVDERMTMSRGIDWFSELANEAVTGYLADSRADATVGAQLKRAWDIRPGLKKAMEESSRLETEEAELSRTTNETRENLKAIEKNPTAALLRKELTERLAQASSRLNDIGKRKVEVRLQIEEQRVRFTDIIRSIKLLKGLPPPT